MSKFFVECPALSGVYVFGLVATTDLDDNLNFSSKGIWLPAGHSHTELFAVLRNNEHCNHILFYGTPAIVLIEAVQIRAVYIKAEVALLADLAMRKREPHRSLQLTEGGLSIKEVIGLDSDSPKIVSRTIHYRDTPPPQGSERSTNHTGLMPVVVR